MYVNTACDKWVIYPIIAHSHYLPSWTLLRSGNMYILFIYFSMSDESFSSKQYCTMLY